MIQQNSPRIANELFTSLDAPVGLRQRAGHAGRPSSQIGAENSPQVDDLLKEAERLLGS
jgi:hypothetical protein